jgi:hypothetical protein
LIGAAGAGGRTLGQVGRVEALELGSFTLKNVLTIFSEDRAGAFANRELAGNIGAQVADRFRVVLDYSHKRVILEPSSTFGDPYDRAFSGVALRAEGPGYHTFRVREILEQSAATDADIREGDVITAVNGTPASDLTLSGRCRDVRKARRVHADDSARRRDGDDGSYTEANGVGGVSWRACLGSRIVTVVTSASGDDSISAVPPCAATSSRTMNRPRPRPRDRSPRRRVAWKGSKTDVRIALGTAPAFRTVEPDLVGRRAIELNDDRLAGPAVLPGVAQEVRGDL